MHTRGCTQSAYLHAYDTCLCIHASSVQNLYTYNSGRRTRGTRLLPRDWSLKGPERHPAGSRSPSAQTAPARQSVRALRVPTPGAGEERGDEVQDPRAQDPASEAEAWGKGDLKEHLPRESGRGPKEGILVALQQFCEFMTPHNTTPIENRPLARARSGGLERGAWGPGKASPRLLARAGACVLD